MPYVNPIEAERRQMKSLKLYAAGKTYAEIAEQTGVKPNTVMLRLKALRKEWGASTTVELCQKMGIECSQDRYAPNRVQLDDKDRQMHELIRQGLTKAIIMQRLRMTNENHKSALRRLKKYYGVGSIRDLATLQSQ